MADKLIEELTEEQCWNCLEGAVVGRLAVCVAGKPDVFPVNFLLDGRSIVLRTAPGFKLAAASLSPTVAFEVDDLNQAEQSGWSVVIRGTATEVEGLEEVMEAADLGVSPWAEGPKNRYVRIEAESISGRRIP